MEKLPDINIESLKQEENEDYKRRLQEVFKKYQEDFSLTEEELKEPLLDVGSGFPAFIEYVRNVYGNQNAFAVERNYQDSKLNPHIKGLVIADGNKLPFDDATFKTIVARYFVPIILKKEKTDALDEMMRVAKPGARIMFSVTKEDATNPESKLSEKLKEYEQEGNKVDFTEKFPTSVVAVIQKKT